jgi:hypothetical protein
MSTNPISASSQSNLAASLGSANRPHRHGGGGSDQGITLLASLLQALTQAVSAGATATGTTAATNTAITDGATAAAGTTAATATGSTTSGTSLAQDLQAFLHDLFHALRHAGQPSHGGGYASAPRPVTTPSPTSAIAAPTATGNGIATAATAATAATSAAGNTGIGAYGQRSIISALRALVQDLSNSQVLSTTGSSSSLSSNALSNLNSAFEKLIGDLGASTSTAGSSTASGSAAASGQSTSALQSFLTNFMRDLQSNGTNSLSSLGSSVDTTA